MPFTASPEKSAQLLRYLFEEASLGIAVEDLDGKILLANPALCSMLGFQKEELCGMDCSQFADPEDSQDDWAFFQKLRAGLIDRYSLEKRYVRKDGAQIWGRLHVSLLNAEPPLVFAFVEEITDRKRTEETLRKSAERFRLAAQAGKMYAYEWDVATNIIVRSPESANILGLTDAPTSFTREQLLDRVHPDDRAKFVAAVADLTPESPSTHLTYRVLRPDGAVIWLEKSGRAFFDGKGKMVRMIGMVGDVTERKQAEERLREYEKAVEASEEMIAVVDREYRYLIANRKFLDYRSMTREQVVGRPVAEVLDKEVFESLVKKKFDECFEGKVVRYEMKYTYPELGERDVFVSYFPIEGVEGVDRAACIVQDITERKRTEEALRESEERFRLAAQAGKMFAYEWDAATDVVVRSEEYARILGEDKASETTGEQAMAKVHPDDRERLKAAVAELSPDKPYLQISYRTVRPDSRMIWIERNSRAFFDKQGRMLRIIGMVRDVTERKQAEEALSGVSRRLIEAQEQERTRIARDLHDDVAQQLALLAIELEQVQQNPSGRASEVSKRIDKLRKQTLEIVNAVQTLSHELHSSKLEYLGIVAAMRSFCKEFGEQRKLKIDFKSHDLPTSLPLEISLSLFRVLQEALHNAAKHSGAGHFEVHLWGKSGEIHLMVSDFGAGFDTEAAMKGQGLGITSMRERLTLLNGELSINSQPKRGTTVHARVPLSSASDFIRAAG